MTGFTAVQRGPETDALIALLRAGDIETGDGIKPDGGGYPGGDSTQQFVPYVVLHTGVVLHIDGPVSDPFADTSSEYQVTAVGETAAQARWGADKARATILPAHLAVAGRVVQLVSWSGSHPAQRDDDITPPLYYAIDLYTVDSTPA